MSDDATWLAMDVEGRLAIGRPGHARFREDAPRLFPELARYAAEQRPNGKITIEASTADFADLRTTVRCSVDHLVLLARGAATPRLVPLSPSDIIERLLAEGSSYGDTVYKLYERALDRLREASAWRLEYTTLGQALQLLAKAQ
jgi:hypothetical protein